jgi:hypothetical protein
MIRLQREPTAPEVRRVPGGKPVAVVLGSVGFASTLLTIFLSAFPAEDDPHKTLAVVKVLGGTMVMIGAGIVMFLIGRFKGRRPESQAGQRG